MHLSQWFAQKKDYSTYLFEDNFLRKTLQQRYTEIEKIKIFRKIQDYLTIKIYIENPHILVGRKGKNLPKFHQEIKKFFKTIEEKFLRMKYKS